MNKAIILNSLIIFLTTFSCSESVHQNSRNSTGTENTQSLESLALSRSEISNIQSECHWLFELRPGHNKDFEWIDENFESRPKLRNKRYSPDLMYRTKKSNQELFFINTVDHLIRDFNNVFDRQKHCETLENDFNGTREECLSPYRPEQMIYCPIEPFRHKVVQEDGEETCGEGYKHSFRGTSYLNPFSDKKVINHDDFLFDVDSDICIKDVPDYENYTRTVVRAYFDLEQGYRPASQAINKLNLSCSKTIEDIQKHKPEDLKKILELGILPSELKQDQEIELSIRQKHEKHVSYCRSQLQITEKECLATGLQVAKRMNPAKEEEVDFCAYRHVAGTGGASLEDPEGDTKLEAVSYILTQLSEDGRVSDSNNNQPGDSDPVSPLPGNSGPTLPVPEPRETDPAKLSCNTLASEWSPMKSELSTIGSSTYSKRSSTRISGENPNLYRKRIYCEGNKVIKKETCPSSLRAGLKKTNGMSAGLVCYKEYLLDESLPTETLVNFHFKLEKPDNTTSTTSGSGNASSDYNIPKDGSVTCVKEIGPIIRNNYNYCLKESSTNPDGTKNYDVSIYYRHYVRPTCVYNRGTVGSSRVFGVSGIAEAEREIQSRITDLKSRSSTPIAAGIGCQSPDITIKI